MDIFTFVFTAVLAFSGLLIGTVLAHYTREEVHGVKQAIPYLQLAVFALLFIVLFSYFPFWPIFIVLSIAMVFIYVFWSKNNLNVLDYIVFALIFVISSLSAQAHFYITLILFCFGIFSGVLYYVMHTKPENKKHHKKTIKHHKHSGKHLSLQDITHEVFVKYAFFLIISISAFLIAKFLELFM